MAQIPNLDNAPLNLTSLREQSQRELVNILKNIRGKKCLVIDQKLSGSLSSIIQTSILKEHGIELRHLSADPIQTDCSKLVYLVRSELTLMTLISLHIHNDTSKALQREYYVYFVPRRAVGCEKILEEEKILRQKAQSMKQDYTDVTSNNQTVSELKDFVKKLNWLPEMTVSSSLNHYRYPYREFYIEEMIHKQEPLVNVLRVHILFSITNSGLPKKHFDYLRRERIHSYGFEHMVTLNNLEKAGLLKKQETKSNWLTVKRALQLVVEDTDTANPNDISYVFSGYAPLSIRLIQHAVRSGWRPIEEILRLLPGPHSEIKRGRFSSSPSLDTLQGHSANVDKVSDGRRSLVLVVFVGGVTFAEISALRFPSAREGMAYDLIIGTTKIANGRSLIETFVGS